jgi:hypothetical protein
MLRQIFSASLMFLALGVSNSFAQITWLNFSEWDHGMVSGGGQSWTDIFEDADVTVTATADNGFSMNTSASVAGIFSPNPEPGKNTFGFTFSKPLPLVVEIQTTDGQEEFRVTGAPGKDYTHLTGAAPLLSTDGSSLVIEGTAYGVNPTGASRGFIYLTSPTSLLTLSHEGKFVNKFERFRVGVLTSPIPEPTGLGVAMASLIGLLGLRRRSK